MASQSELSSTATTAVASSPSSQPTAPTMSISNPSQEPTASSQAKSDGPSPQSQPKQQDPPKDTLPSDSNQPISATISNPTDPATMSPATTAAARNAILAHLSNVGSTSLAPMSQRAADIGAAHSSIAKQREGVEASTTKLAKESDRLTKEAEKADDVLKDIGNVDNWAQLLDRDISVLEETLRIVDEEEEMEDGEFDGQGEGDGQVDEEGRPVGRKKKGTGKAAADGKEGWLWGLWPGGKSAS